jgi:hypothetical protein
MCACKETDVRESANDCTLTSREGHGSCRETCHVNFNEIHKINWFSDFVHCLYSKELEDKSTTFQKLDLFLPSGKGRHLLCWVPIFLSSNSLEYGRWTKFKNPLILCVIHCHQNPIESIWWNSRFLLGCTPCTTQYQKQACDFTDMYTQFRHSGSW